MVVLEIGYEVVLHQVQGIFAALIIGLAGAGFVDSGHHPASIGRHLRHEGHAQFAAEFSAERAPRDDVFLAYGGLRPDGHEGVQPLIVQRTIDIYAERLAVARHGVAVGASVDTFHQQMTAALADVEQAPGNQRNRAGGQRLDDTFLGFRGHQGHVAVEDRRAHRVGGRADAHLSAG